ncbi:uncharacterized protein Dwil_GK19121 [Drosophila willistoni]|uniref:Uncharacterized protein n=1 Tax=Drosophila willistoni TaxID=7260 RepID=B4NF20_DROWI|nr:uncharacterized protein LOC6649459 [Drosophila willistoni]EDW83395.2 uncharacterized protein Dwil_GK19121 [Drosophila willistoni]
MKSEVVFLYILLGLGKLCISTSLKRSKRVALFDGQGVNKFVMGFAYPVPQEDKQQSFWAFVNYQHQYQPANAPIWWWSFWNTSTFVSTAREWQNSLYTDESRSWIYDVIETGLEQLNLGGDSKTCLLRGICEISQLPFQNDDIFTEIFNAVLIPTLDNVADRYLHARNAGRAGADCIRTFNQCDLKTWHWLSKVVKMTN